MADRNFPSPAGVTLNILIMRVAFLVALLLGLGSMLHIFHFTIVTLDLHIAAGLIVAIVIWFLAISFSRRKSKGRGALWLAAVLMVIGGIVGLFFSITSGALGITHLIIMVVAMILAEMGASAVLNSKKPA